jgi:anti-sigma regulatory factor (Ser/Thr protein kinase)
MSSTDVACDPVEISAASVAGLRSMRRALAECLGDAWPRHRVTDAQVVLAEIVTNAFVHDAAPTVAASIVADDDSVTITIRHRGSVAPPPAPASVGDPGVPGGRGLAIVDRLVSTRRAVSVRGQTSTVVVMTA